MTRILSRHVSRMSAVFMVPALAAVLLHSPATAIVLWDESLNGDLESTILPPLKLGVNEIRGRVDAFVPDSRDEAQFQVPDGMILDKFLIVSLPGIDFRGPSISINMGAFANSQVIEFINTATFHSLPFDLLQFDSAPGPQPPGVYNFDLVRVPEASGSYVLQIVTRSTATVTIQLDVKPGSCPNVLNGKSKGVIPVAVLGTAAFDVHEIDLATLRLEDVPPVRSSYEDIANPTDEPCGCPDARRDGWLDLALKFETQAVVRGIAGSLKGAQVVLTGALLDGTQFVGVDCIVLTGKHGSTEPESIGLSGAATTPSGALTLEEPTTWGRMKAIYR